MTDKFDAPPKPGQVGYLRYRAEHAAAPTVGHTPGLTKYLFEALRELREAVRPYDDDKRLDAAKRLADAALSRYLDTSA